MFPHEVILRAWHFLGWQVLIVVCFIHPTAPAADKPTYGRWQRVQRIPVVSVFVTRLARRSYETATWQMHTPLITFLKVADTASAKRTRLPWLKTWGRQVDAAEVGWRTWTRFIRIKKLNTHLHKGNWIRKAVVFSLAQRRLSFFFFFYFCSFNFTLVSEVLRKNILLWNRK